MILEGKSVLVTGGTGSLGRTLVRRILSGEAGVPRKVVVLSRDEAKQHDMRRWYLNKRAVTDEVIYENSRQLLEFRIGDVRDYGDVCRSVRDADVVFNAAALKQVPTCEYFPEQALLTNCIGPMNVSRAIVENDYPVETVVAISTDKACKPVNVMGMTKALQERIFVASNLLASRTRFVAARYGNVLASRGSVIPHFHEQIRNGGPVTVTAAEMTRFLMTLDEAVDMILTTVRDARPGETFVPICPSATVVNIADALIDGRAIDIVFTGPRPGEKLHETLISEEEIRHVRRRSEYFAISSMLPELMLEGDTTYGELTKEYSSADCVVSRDETAALLEKHGLMIGQRAAPIATEELLR
jgi:FlaA1/EpsC-like NDP-sugar epimerase